MIKGLTSVTFRSLSVGEIIDLAKSAGLDGIEWGGDIHLPPGDVALAKAVREKTVASGLKVLSYGSYYKIGMQDNPAETFAPVLQTAVCLKASVIRVWAGQVSSKDCDEALYQKMLCDLKIICKMAAEQGLTVALEYHRGTLTDTAESALGLLKDADCENLKTYWQPNPELAYNDNLRELKAVRAYLSHIHVFYWQGDGTRLPLSCGAEDWAGYLAALPQTALPQNFSHAAILEFVKDEQKEQFFSDAETLSKLVEGVI